MPAKKLNKIKLLLVDDHPIVLEGIKSRLSAQPEFEVVGDANNGREAIRKARRLQPHVILLDISMPQLNGMEAISQLRRQAPAAKILVLTMHENREYIAQTLRLGARGYLLKDASPSELIRAIKAVHDGEVYFSPTASKVLLDEVIHLKHGGPPASASGLLTDREHEVLTRIAEGHSNKRIADLLGLSVRTVETHRENVMRKLDIHSVAGLTRYAIAHGMIAL